MGIDVPMFIDASMSCNAPVEQEKAKTREVNGYVSIVRKAKSQFCAADVKGKGTAVISGFDFDFPENPQGIVGALFFVKESEMTITRKVR